MRHVLTGLAVMLAASGAFADDGGCDAYRGLPGDKGRPAARQPQEIDLSAGHLGFRTVLSKPIAVSSSEGGKQ